LLGLHTVVSKQLYFPAVTDKHNKPHTTYPRLTQSLLKYKQLQRYFKNIHVSVPLTKFPKIVAALNLFQITNFNV